MDAPYLIGYSMAKRANEGQTMSSLVFILILGNIGISDSQAVPDPFGSFQDS